MNRSRLQSLRTALLAAVLVAGLAFLARSGFGQTPAAPGAPAVEQAPQGPGLFRLIVDHVDLVTVTILILSVLGLTLIIQGFIRFRKSVFLPEPTTERIRTMIEERRFKELLDFTETDPSFVSRAINPALKRAPRFNAMKEAMETAIGEQTAEQFRRIEFLNVIGNLGPLLGLLGTVVGMIYTFSAVQAAGGQANAGVVGGGIAVALAHTFMGLLLAVPCLAAYGVLRTMVDRLTVRGAIVAEDLLLMMKPPEDGKPGMTAVAAAPAVSRPAPAAPQPVAVARKA